MFFLRSTKKEILDAGYKYWGIYRLSCKEHGKIVEHFYLPNSHNGTRDYEEYCPKHKRTLIDYELEDE